MNDLRIKFSQPWCNTEDEGTQRWQCTDGKVTATEEKRNVLDELLHRPYKVLRDLVSRRKDLFSDRDEYIRTS